jgi:hypothetical protein
MDATAIGRMHQVFLHRVEHSEYVLVRIVQPPKGFLVDVAASKCEFKPGLSLSRLLPCVSPLIQEDGFVFPLPPLRVGDTPQRDWSKRNGKTVVSDR